MDFRAGKGAIDGTTPEYSAAFVGGNLGTGGVSAYNVGLYTSSTPPSGGAGGAAVINNSFITWVVAGTRLGALL